jgi:hypothetical protein
MLEELRVCDQMAVKLGCMDGERELWQHEDLDLNFVMISKGGEVLGALHDEVDLLLWMVQRMQWYTFLHLGLYLYQRGKERRSNK